MMLLSISACGNEQPTTESQKESNSTAETTEEILKETSDNTKESSMLSADVSSVGSIEEIESNVEKDVENTINSLNTEWQTLSAKITSYDDYVKNADEVEAFYEKINDDTKQLCDRLQTYTVKYAEMILSSDMSNDDKYDAFDDLSDCIYDKATDDINDGIYEGLLEDMQDALYDGVLDDSDVASSYSEWYDVRSDEYEYWYDTRSDVYENYYDTRSDVYSFIYDIRGELWSGEIEKAKEKFDDYKADVEKLTKN